MKTRASRAAHSCCLSWRRRDLLVWHTVTVFFLSATPFVFPASSGVSTVALCDCFGTTKWEDVHSWDEEFSRHCFVKDYGIS